MGRTRIVWLLGLVACGRTPFGDHAGQDGASAAEASGTESPNTPDDDDDDDDGDGDPGLVFLAPPDLPIEDATCGNGVIDPGELCYLPHAQYESRIDPCALAIADFDLDGHLDVVVPNSDFEELETPLNVASVLRGDGSGTLGAPEPWAAGIDYPVGVTVGDFDSDGLLDLAITNSSPDVPTDGMLHVLRAAAPASFTAPVGYHVGDSPVMSATGDIDNDGDLDLAVTGNAGADISVLHNQGDGTFALAGVYPSPGSPWELILEDLSGDGVLDMAVATSQASLVQVWAGLGDGVFAVAGSLPTGPNTLGLIAADLDADGWLDLVATNADEATVSVYMADGVGTYTARDKVAAGTNPRSLVAGDFDSDGRLDIATADVSTNTVLVLIGDGDGAVEPSLGYLVGANPSTVRAGDLNEDGVLDLVTSNQSSNTVGVLLSNP